MGHAEQDADHPERDSTWDSRARHETPAERLDRNWNDLLQELRVVQTGVQLLTGFLLTLPFQARFVQLSGFQREVYLVTVACSVVATGLLVAPVSVHRALFRQRARLRLVSVAHRLALLGLSALALAIIGAVLLIGSVVSGVGVGRFAALGAAVLLVSLWVTLPLALRHADGTDADAAAP